MSLCEELGVRAKLQGSLEGLTRRVPAIVSSFLEEGIRFGKDDRRRVADLVQRERRGGRFAKIP